MLVSAHFLIFVQPGIPANGMVLSAIRAGLPSVVKPFWKCTHRYSKKCFYGESKSNQLDSEESPLHGVLMMDLSWFLWSHDKKYSCYNVHVPVTHIVEISQIPSKGHNYSLINGRVNIS